jgi:hypothetical protein
MAQELMYGGVPTVVGEVHFGDVGAGAHAGQTSYEGRSACRAYTQTWEVGRGPDLAGHHDAGNSSAGMTAVAAGGGGKAVSASTDCTPCRLCSACTGRHRCRRVWRYCRPTRCSRAHALRPLCM